VRLLDTLFSRSRNRREIKELRALYAKLSEGRGQRDVVIARVPLPSLAGDILNFEGVYSRFQLPEQPSPAEIVHLEQLFKHLLALRGRNGVEPALREFLDPLANSIPELPEGEEDLRLSVSA
jgi:hypothetical protein